MSESIAPRLALRLVKCTHLPTQRHAEQTRPRPAKLRCTAVRRFDLKFVQAQVDDIELLNANDKSSKPYFLFYKNGSEVAKVTGANAVEIEQHVQKHATKKPKE